MPINRLFDKNKLIPKAVSLLLPLVIFCAPVFGEGGSVMPMPVPSPAPSAPPIAPPRALKNLQPVLQGDTTQATLQTGTNQTTLQTSTESALIQAGTDASLLRTGVEREAAPVNILFIVDGSRSMLERLEGDTQKIDAAKQVLQNALSRIPQDVNLGLRVFGQGYQPTNHSMFQGGFPGMQMDMECHNTALWVPLGRGNRRTIIEKVRQIKPYGMTPLAYAIEQAAISDFRGSQGGKTIILITDGADTCNGDPCAVIKQLPLYGINIKVDVVGLALRREPFARAQLNCISEKSGGHYYDANTAADLIESVSHSVSKAIEGRVIVRPSAKDTVNPINTETPTDLVPIESK